MATTGMEKIKYPDDISPPDDLPDPAVDGWYILEKMSTSDPNIIGWLVAQGWEIYETSSSSITYDGEAPIVNRYYYLKRTRIDSQKALKALTADYTTAYNEGRKLNDQRYDYAIDLYKKIIDSIEEEFTLMDPIGGTNAVALQTIIDGFDSDLTAFEAKVRASLSDMLDLEETTLTTLDTDETALVNSFLSTETTALSGLLSITTGIINDFETSQKAEINARFDSELAKVSGSLTTKGLYNTTIVSSTNAGIERERSRALLVVDDVTAKQKMALQEKLASYQSGLLSRMSSFQTQIKEMIYSYKTQANTRMYQARLTLEKLLYDAMADKQTKKFTAQESIWKLVTEMIVQRITLRNKAVSDLCEFVERRTDSYPDLASIGDAVSKIGVGSINGGTP